LALAARCWRACAHPQDVFCLNFTASYESFGATVTHELKPGGAAIPVTAANLQEYVDAYTQWYLVGSVETQFKHFCRGFVQVHRPLCV
jgi:hypothetical protein